jgi:hypothetical protein
MNKCGLPASSARSIALRDKPRTEPKAAEDHHEQGRAAHAVDIVVAEYHHVLAVRDRRPQPGRARLQIAQEKRIVDRRERRLQKRRGGPGIALARPMQKLREHAAHPGALAERLDLFGRRRRMSPAHGVG